MSGKPSNKRVSAGDSGLWDECGVRHQQKRRAVDGLMTQVKEEDPGDDLKREKESGAALVTQVKEEDPGDARERRNLVLH